MHLPIVAFEPEEDLIYVRTIEEKVEELNISKLKSEFEKISNNVFRALARCVRCDGSLELISFYLDISREWESPSSLLPLYIR